MQVLLQENIRKLGKLGDVVSVKTGYARNFLLPRGLAVTATKNNVVAFEARKADLHQQDQDRKAVAQNLAKALDNFRITLIRRAGDSGQLYGGVSTTDLVNALKENGFTLDKTQILFDKPIKTIGLHPYTVVLHADVAVSILVNVAKSLEEAETQAAAERD
jgi:large subunit ribosomal protein L9